MKLGPKLLPPSEPGGQTPSPLFSWKLLTLRATVFNPQNLSPAFPWPSVPLSGDQASGGGVGVSQQPHTQSPACGPHVPGILGTPQIPGPRPSQGVGEASGGSPGCGVRAGIPALGRVLAYTECSLSSPPPPGPSIHPSQESLLPSCPTGCLWRRLGACFPEDLWAWGLHRQEPVGDWVLVPQAIGHWQV